MSKEAEKDRLWSRVGGGWMFVFGTQRTKARAVGRGKRTELRDIS